MAHSEAALTEAIMDVVEDIETLREIYGPPNDRSLKKQLSRFDRHCRAFIARSPFLVIASSDPSGRCDASPKGDAPGFVQVIDDETLLIPDRLGNNRVDTIGNLLERPGVGLIFFVPGLNETLRVNGRARLITDPALLEPLAVNGKVPRSGILVAAEEIYFHCGKALIRSDLWNPDKQLRRSEFPSLGRILADQIGGISVEESERLTTESYRTRLY
jgi:PPOX class probable FMN-dependent enzyme